MSMISKSIRGTILILAIASLTLAGCSSTVVRSSASGTAVSVAKPGASAVVQRGDTVYRIATSNGISPLDLAMWNNIDAPYTIYPGQRLRLYPQSGSSGSRATTGTASSPTAERPGSRSSRPAPAPSTPSVAAPITITSAVAWRWPADGALISRFQPGEPTRQGIDIAGAAGSPVKAAGDGIVVYSGSGLVGYGELIIIKHDEQWLSAYGHNRKRLVTEGQMVKSGQQVAELGRSGASRDMLHFEVRHNGKPVDPLQYLPRK